MSTMKPSLFERASAAWDKGNKRAAFALFKKAAEEGDASSQHNLGYFYDEGVGVRKNKRLALVWYRRAWSADRQGGTCMNIAQIYAEAGKRKQAIQWLNRAVRMGDGDAALELASFYADSATKRYKRRRQNLLKMALRSKHVTEDAREKAQRLLRSLD